MNYLLNPLYNLTACKKVTVNKDTSEQAVDGVLSQEGHPLLCLEETDCSGAKLTKHRAGSAVNCLFGYKIEKITSWKTNYPTDRPQTTQISLAQRRRSRKQHQLE